MEWCAACAGPTVKQSPDERERVRERGRFNPPTHRPEYRRTTEVRIILVLNLTRSRSDAAARGNACPASRWGQVVTWIHNQ